MATIDERVVQMRFDNAAFQRGVQQTLSSLQSLNRGLQMQGATKGLQSIGTAASNQRAAIQGVGNTVEQVQSRFSQLQVIATTAMATIAHSAVSGAGRVLKSFTLDPIIQGFKEYETNMNSIQTIMANTGLKGQQGLNTVNKALNELNHYSDQTIYNFSEMAKNIGTFTAAGVKLNVATAAIKGIANLAAMSGSNSEQASAAMYQLSQAISAGKVSLEDWNSVVNAGMGGKVFQNALVETARVHGVKVDEMIKKNGSFRLSLQEGWLTGKILTETLSKFTGDLNAQQLKSMGYNKDQIKGILEMGKTAQDAATKVKTMTQLISTLREGLGSGWAKTWQLIFGDFGEAKSMFTDFGVALGSFVDKSNDARNKVLGDWKELGGRTVLIDGIKKAFQALGSILGPIKDAFREIFPATTGKNLYDMTVSFRDFMERLKLGGQTANELKRTFAGVFAIFGIGWEIVKQVLKTIFSLFGEVGKGAGSFLGATASVGDFFVALHKAIKEGDGLAKFFQGLGKILALPIKLIQKLGGYLSDLFSGADTGKAGKAVGDLTDKLSPMAQLGEMVANAWDKVMGVMDKVWAGIQNIASKVGDFIEPFSSGIADALDNLNLDDVFSGINTGLFAGLVLMLKNFLGGGGGGGILSGITDAIEEFTGVLSSMQTTLRATTLLQIALAVGILAIAMNTLSKIDAAGLTRAGAAIGVLFTQLLGAMLIFEKFSGFKGFAKMPFVAASMILLGVAINILAQAVETLAALDWNELAKGLTGTIVLIGALVGVSKLMANPKGMISTALGLVLLGAAIKILASAVEDLSGLGWEEMAKGLIGVGVLLGALTLFSKFAGANATGVLGGVGIILLATGIKILASAVQQMSGMSWGEIAKGLVTMAGAMAIMVGALMLIPPTAPLGALAVLGVAMSLGMVAKALQEMAELSWGEIAKSLVLMLGSLAMITAALILIPPTAPIAAVSLLITAIALKEVAKALQEFASFGWEEIAKAMVLLFGTLLLISAGMILMTAALPGAAALLVVAAALAVLAPVLMQFGAMDWMEILKSLTMLAGVFVIFGAAALVLAPVVPIMMGLGLAITLLGIGALAAGAGVLLFATGLSVLAASGVAATAAIVGIVKGLVGLIPYVMKQIGLGLIAFAEVIGTAGPAITKAIVTVLNSLINAIVKMVPKIVDAMYKMLSRILDTMQKYVPRMVDSGMKLIIGILSGMAKHVGKAVDVATTLIVNFINAISRNTPRVLNAGANMIIKFINDLASTIRGKSAQLGAAGANLATAIIGGMARGLAGGLATITQKAMSIAKSALNAAKSVLGIHSPSKEFEKIGKYVNDGFKKGLDGNKQQIDDSFNEMKKQLTDLKKNSKATARERAKAASAYTYLTKYLNDERSAMGKLADKYDEYTKKIEDANKALEDAIKTRDDYNKSVSDQYGDIASAKEDTKVADYVTDLKKQLEDTKVFANTMQRLRAFGLNDEMYKDLLATGTTALPFVLELLANGRESIDEINGLNSELDRVGADLGKNASTALYQAGVDSAKGFVDGLVKEQANIEKQMDTIADKMVKAIKKKLGIKSPSRVFAAIGQWTAKGLSKGLDESSDIIAKSASGMGEQAVESLRKSMSNMADMVTRDIDNSPVITPVLDLSEIKKDAAGINGFLGFDPKDSPKIGGVSYDKAKYVASRYASNQDAQTQAQSVGNTTNYTQNNYSPKAISTAEVYRNTKNQLSTTKGGLST